MKNQILKVIPFISLIASIVLYYINQNNNPYIIVSMAALCGYVLYLEDKKKPNYLEIFKEDIENLEVSLKKRMSDIEHVTSDKINLAIKEVSNTKSEVNILRDQVGAKKLAEVNSKKPYGWG